MSKVLSGCEGYVAKYMYDRIDIDFDKTNLNIQAIDFFGKTYKVFYIDWMEYTFYEQNGNQEYEKILKIRPSYIDGKQKNNILNDWLDEKLDGKQKSMVDLIDKFHADGSQYCLRNSIHISLKQTEYKVKITSDPDQISYMFGLKYKKDMFGMIFDKKQLTFTTVGDTSSISMFKLAL